MEVPRHIKTLAMKYVTDTTNTKTKWITAIESHRDSLYPLIIGCTNIIARDCLCKHGVDYEYIIDHQDEIWEYCIQTRNRHDDN